MKKILLSLLILACLGLTAACGVKDDDSQDQADMVTINLGAMPSIDKVPIIVAEEKGYFAKYGVDVKLENFQSPTDRNAALQSGKLDGVMSDMVADILYLKAGLNLKMTSLIQTDFAIVASPQSGITSLGDVTPDDTDGIALNCLIEYIADEAGIENNILLADVSARVEEVVNGDIDLTIVPEPYGAMAVSKGAIDLGNAGDLGIDCAVMLFTADFMETHPDAVRGFYQGYEDAVAYLASADPDAYLDSVIEKGGFSEDTRDFISATDFQSLSAPSEDQFDAVQAWMNTKADFDGPFDYDFNAVSDFSFLQ